GWDFHGRSEASDIYLSKRIAWPSTTFFNGGKFRRSVQEKIDIAWCGLFTLLCNCESAPARGSDKPHFLSPEFSHVTLRCNRPSLSRDVWSDCPFLFQREDKAWHEYTNFSGKCNSMVHRTCT